MELIKKIAGYAVKVIFSVGIIAFLLYKSNVKLEHFKGISPVLLILAALAILVQNTITAVRWRSLLKSCCLDLSLFDAISLTMQGIFFTLFIPCGAVSGDIVKAGMLAVRLSPQDRFTGIASILMDRICGFAGLLFSVLVSTLFYSVCFPDFTTAMGSSILIVAVCCFAGLCAIFALFFYQYFLRIRFINSIWKWCDKITHGFFERTVCVLEAYKKQWKKLLFWAAASGFFLFPLYSVSFYCIAKAVLPSDVPCLAPSFIGALLGDIVGIIPLTPGGIGTRDALVAVVYRSFGIPPENAAVITTIFTIVFISVSALGALFLIGGSMKKK